MPLPNSTSSSARLLPSSAECPFTWMKSMLHFALASASASLALAISSTLVFAFEMPCVACAAYCESNRIAAGVSAVVFAR